MDQSDAGKDGKVVTRGEWRYINTSRWPTQQTNNMIEALTCRQMQATWWKWLGMVSFG